MIIKKIINPDPSAWSLLLQRPTRSLQDIEGTVNEIFDDVNRNGDRAVQKYTSIFDAVDINDMAVSEIEFSRAERNVSPELKSAMAIAKKNIRQFHEAQQVVPPKIETLKGVVCWMEKRPIEKIGLYIPGGTAPLFSTVLMLAVPAEIAGCKEIVLCSPPGKSGNIADEILYAARICGVSKVYKVGGIQAIAALTFGTESIPSVYKIFGPGNQYVTVAKQIATKYGTAIDMPAGPSELLIFADDSANAAYVAADLLSQAEHGVDSQVILISTSGILMNAVEEEINKQCVALPRKDIVTEALNNAKFILVENDQIALEIINDYGPEHLIICSKNPNFYTDGIQNAGSVFIGNYSPESAGDYATGTNHTLPTNGYSKAYSGVNLDSFMKNISFQKISSEGLKQIGNTIEILAEAEGLQAHKNAVTIRLKDIG